MSVLDLMPGWSFFTFAILVPVVGWLVFGMYASFPDERRGQAIRPSSLSCRRNRPTSSVNGRTRLCRRPVKAVLKPCPSSRKPAQDAVGTPT